MKSLLVDAGPLVGFFVNLELMFCVSLQFIGSAAFAQPKDQVFIEDLRLLTSKVSRYNVDGVTPRQALEKLFELALGSDGGIPLRIKRDDGKALDEKVLPTIRLDLENETSIAIIRYISELAGCRYRIWGWPGGPVLELSQLTSIDDTDLLETSRAMSCSEKAATALGLKKGMNQKEVLAVFAQYGAEIGDRGAIYWNSSTNMIAVRGERSGLVFALVQLAENGWQIVKSKSNTAAPKTK